MESKRTATTYFIPPGKFLLMENALGNPDLIQSSVSSDCRVTIVDKANFPLDELEQWPTFRLVSADIQLKLGSGSYYIYIVVPTPDNEDTTTAFISYNTSLVDRDGYEVIASTDEDGNSVTSKGPLLGKEGFKYYQCGVVSERGKNLGAITVPEGLGRLISIDLGVNPQDDSVQKKMDKDYFNSLFIPHYDNPDNPEELTWIEAKSNLGVNGGITMYVNEGKYTPSTIMDALAVDNVNLKVVDGVLTFVGTSGSESVPLLGDLKNVGEWANAIATEDRIMVQKKDSTTWTSLLLSEIGGTADFSNVKESGEGNAFTSFTLSEDKKTLTFVKGDSFTKKADFDTLNAKVTDFLEGSDTDNIINKWKELEAFLDGMSESSDLADILSDKADKSTTLSGYGITNAYTKNEADDLLDEKADWGTTLSHYGITNAYTKTEADSLLDKKWTQDDSKIENWDTAFGWGDHSKAGYSTKTYVDETFVTLKTEQTITGKKDFTTGGLFVNGSQIVYDSTNGYWKLDGDLLVTGAVTMFANDGKYTPSTITDGVNIDNRTIIRKDGALMINPELELGGGEGGELSSVAWGNIIGTPTWITDTKPEYKFEEIKEKPTTLDKYGITDAKIESGVITLGGNTITPLVESKANELYVTSLGTSGNNLIWTLNGEAKTITVPYASKSNKATYSTFLRAYLGNYERISDLNEPSTYTEDQSTLSDSPFRIVYDAFSRNAANKPETFNNANVLLTLFKGVHTTGVGQYVSQLYFPDADVVYFRRSTSDGFKGWKKFAFTDSDITGNAATSTKATQDADGNVISSTYAKGDGTNATGTWNISISGESNRVKCTEGTGDAYRPMVVTNPDATTQNLFYGTKIQGNYATGDLKMTSATIDEIKIYKSNDDVLYLDCNLVVRGGVTMYGTNSASAPSILDSLPIANTSGTKGIATFDSTYFIVSNGKVSLIADSVGLNEDELAAYLTQEKYARQSDIDTRINGLINGAPEAYDTLKEIADVLDKNVNGVGDILEALGNKADKGTTLAEYGITDAKISDGTITLGGNTITPLTQSSGDARYVTALGTSGNDLTWTLNGLLKKITIPYATTANQLTKWKVLTIKKNTDSGTVYKLIANLSNWNTGYNGQWGMVGMMYGHRGGYMSGTTMQKIVAYCAAWSASSGGTGYELKTDITTYVKPCIVSYNGVTYLALKMAGSGSSREHSFLGYTENLLEEFIEVTESAATLVHDTEVMSMGGVNVASSSKLATPRTIWGQSFDGTENVSGAITGATTGSFSDEVSMKSASVDGISIYKSSTGVLRIDGDVVLSGALTMYGTNSASAPSILDSLPIANTSGTKGIATFDSTYFIVSNGKVSLIADSVGLNEDELAAYLTQEKYARQSDIDTRINGLINGAPEAYDTLKEIADVLDKNVNGVGDILEALGNKADKGTTLAEYGITDAKISDGTITLGGNTITPLTQSSGDARYVTALGTSGNDLTWTLNGLLKKITIPYATTANQLTKWKVLTIKKNTDSGTVYKLIANLSNWNTGYNGQWGMVGMMYGHRGGYMSGTTMQKIVAYCAAWSASSGGTGYELKTDITTYVKPCIVSYNGVTYLALKMAGSGSSREHSFLGYTENLLEEFIEVTESAATLVHDTEVMSMGGVNVASSSKLATPRTIWGQSFDGTENVSGAITGATTGSFSDEVSMKSASVDGISIYKSSTGVLRIDGDVVLSGALTMFGTDSVNTSTIMDGVVVDGTTIIKKDGKTLMLNPNIELGGGLDDVNVTGAGNAVTGASLSNNILTLTKGATFLTSHQTIYNLTMNAGKFTAVTFDPNGAAQIVNIPTKTSHLANDSNFITSSYVDGKFVTIAGDEDVTGVHNFTNGLEVGGIKVSKSQDGVIYLEGNLVVSGGVTMFGTNSVTSSTVMDGVMVDDTTIRKNPTTGKLEVIGGTGGGLDEAALADYLSTNKYLTQTSGDNRYLLKTSYTASDILTKLKTVDGSGSGLDADLLDGMHSARFPILNTYASADDLNDATRAGYYIVSASDNIPSGFYNYGMLETIEVYTGVSESEQRIVQVYYPHQASSAYKYNAIGIRFRNAGSWTAWRSIVTKDGNVASATTATNLASAPVLSVSGTSQITVKAGGQTSSAFTVPYATSANSASKLSTTSVYSAWGQTYWTSGGVPTSISGDMTNVGNVTSETSNSYSLGSSANLWKDVWAGNVKYTNSAYLGFTSSYASIRHGGIGSQLIVDSTSVRTNSTASARASLGTSSVPWAGLYSTLGNFSEKITMSGTTADACNITFEREHGYIQFNSSINFSSGTASGADTVMRIANTGMVGINTYSPEYALHVIGDIGNAYARLRYSESNPLLHLYRETTDENWYVQAINGYIAIGSTSSKSCKIDTSGNLLATGGMTAGAFSFGNGYQKSISSAGWYRFATSTTANNAGGTYMFFIRRSYANSNNEAYIISCIVDHGKVHWTLLNGHANTRLITQVRCTYTNSGTIYFDLYYNEAVSNTVYVNAVGDCTLQVPTSTSSTLTSTSTFDLGNGMIIDGDLLVKGGITMYATSSTSPITEFYASYLKVTGNMDIVGNINSTYYMLNNTVTNPYLKFTHTYNGANYTHYLQGYQGYLYLGTGTSTSLRISSDGSLYTPKTLTQGSDIRYKDVHKDLLLSLSTIAEAPSFEFNFKDDEQKSTHIGTSAQYWQSVNGVVTEDSEGRLGMDYSSLGVVMGISLAKELSRFESDTDRRIRLLEEENEELRKEIEQLKNK